MHVHVLPRRLAGRPDGSDAFSKNNDAIYPALENSESSLPRDLRIAEQEVLREDTEKEPKEERMSRLKVDADDARPPRTLEEMVREADWLRGLFAGESQPKN